MGIIGRREEEPVTGDVATGWDEALAAVAAGIPQGRIEASAQLPASTPLLTMFMPRAAGPALVGTTPTGDSVTLTTAAGFTVAVAWLPQTSGLLPRVLCDERHSTLGRTYVARADDAEENRTAPLESAAFSARYKLRVHRQADPISLRTLFEPTLIEWLTDAPPGFGFELEQGLLVLYRSDGPTDEAATRALWDAAVDITRRLREAVSGRSASAGFADAPAVPAEYAAHLDMVRFDAPPTSVEAVRAFARRRWRLAVGPLRYGLEVGGALFVLMSVVGVGPIVLTSGFGTSAIAGLVILGAVSLYIVKVVSTRDTTSEAIKLGEYAFATEYARSRSLRLVAATEFTAARSAAEIPGRVQIAATGRLPGGTDGDLAMCAIGTTLEAGQEFEAVVVDVGAGAAQPSAGDAPPGGTAVVHGTLLVVTTAPAPPLSRTPQSLDDVCDTTARIAARVRVAT